MYWIIPVNVQQVKTMRRRLLEAPKESCNDEVNKRMLRAAKILERMVNQNTYDEIAQGIGINIVANNYMYYLYLLLICTFSILF